MPTPRIDHLPGKHKDSSPHDRQDFEDLLRRAAALLITSPNLTQPSAPAKAAAVGSTESFLASAS